MAKEKKKVHVNTSGWEADEVEQLDTLVGQARVDRSKFLRALVRKEWTEKKMLDALDAVVVGKQKAKQ